MVHPIIVREVRKSLEDAGKSAAIIGSAAVVNTLIGGLWGTLFDLAGDNREAINIIGEIGKRSISPVAQSVASKAYVRSRESYGSDNSPVYNIPQKYDRDKGSYVDGSGKKSNYSNQRLTNPDINLFDSTTRYRSKMLPDSQSNSGNSKKSSNKNKNNNKKA